MKTLKFGIAASACVAALMLCSCNSRPAEWEDAWVTQDIVASPVAEAQIRIDGEAAPGEWDDAQEYNLARAQEWGYEKMLPRQRKREDTTPFERGYFKVKYDDDNLYVLAVLDDEDIVQTSREDQAPAFETGDTIEVFLKPEDKSAVWELYGTPWSKVTTLFHPWPGHSSLYQQKFVPGIKAAALARPAADPEKDKSGWTIEMAIPRTLIEQTGGTFAPDKEWRILLCRYNCGKNLPHRQISSTPRLPRTDHLLTDYYAKLKFKPVEGEKKAPEAKPAVDEKNVPEAKPVAESEKKAPAAAKPAVKENKAPAAAKPAVNEKKAPAAKPAVEENKAPAAKPAVKEKKAPAAAKPAVKGNKAPAAAKPAVKGNKAPEKKGAADKTGQASKTEDK